MTKDQLITALQSIEGNPEVCLWNGYVSDYNKLNNVSVFNLVKEDVGFIQSNLEYEYMRDNKTSIIPEDVKEGFSNTAKELHKKQEWGFPNKFVKESEFKRWYGTKTKKIVLIDVKPRNKETWDRLGAVRY